MASFSEGSLFRIISFIYCRGNSSLFVAILQSQKVILMPSVEIVFTIYISSVTFTGLGSKSQGLVEPVPVVVYPSGKSLDWCMNAKSACGRENDPKGVIYLDKKRKTQASIDKAKVKAAAEASTSDPSQNVFDIINNKLGGSSKVAAGKSVSGMAIN